MSRISKTSHPVCLICYYSQADGDKAGTPRGPVVVGVPGGNAVQVNSIFLYFHSVFISHLFLYFHSVFISHLFALFCSFPL